MFFFFQAEDGIRDGHVTGVQTCALPIFPREERCFMKPAYDVAVVGAGPYGLSVAAHLLGRGLRVAVFGKTLEMWREIGRASCRERVEMVVVGGSLEIKEYEKGVRLLGEV